jgi:hypothetical protein
MCVCVSVRLSVRPSVRSSVRPCLSVFARVTEFMHNCMLAYKCYRVQCDIKRSKERCNILKTMTGNEFKQCIMTKAKQFTESMIV